MRYRSISDIILLPFVYGQSIISLSEAQESALASAENAYKASMQNDPGWSSVNSVVSSELGGRFSTGRVPQTALNSLYSARPEIQIYYISLASLQASILESVTAIKTSTGIPSSTSGSLATSVASPVITSSSSVPTASPSSVATSAAPTANMADTRGISIGMIGYGVAVGIIGAGAVLL